MMENGGRQSLPGVESVSVPIQQGASTVALPLPSQSQFSIARKVAAEFVGTFMLIFSCTAVAVLNRNTPTTLLVQACASGLAVLMVVFATGHISGAHLNPSITLAFAAFHHFPWKHVPLYVVAQALASIGASHLLKVIFHPAMEGGMTVPSGSNSQAFVLEFIITFNLMFVITAVATDTRAAGELAGIAVGGTAMLNVLIAGETTGAAMNPVRTLGPAIAANYYGGIWLYLTAPVLGALAAAAVHSAIKPPDPGI